VRFAQVTRGALASLLVVGAVSCLPPDITPLPPEVGTLTVSSLPDSLYVGSSANLTSNVRDVNNVDLPNEPRIWSSSNNSVATVSSTGAVTGVGPGSANITVRAGARTASVAARVIARVATVTLAPKPLELFPGRTQALSVSLQDNAANALTGRVVSWGTRDSSVATVSPAGLVRATPYTGGVSRTTRVFATSENVTDSVIVLVTPTPVATVVVAPAAATLTEGNPATATLTATVRDSSSNTLNRTVTWASSNTAVATVSPSGVVSAVSQGTATISATAGGVTGQATITVNGRPVATVVVAPDTFTIQDGRTRQLTATLRDADGALLTGRVVTWTSLDAARATVNASGLVTGGAAAGTARIVATSEGVADTSVATVTLRAVQTVTTASARDSAFVGDSVLFTAVAVDAAGDTITGRAVTWTSLNSGIATVSTAGWVRGVAGGIAQIRATIGGVQSALDTLRVLAPVNTVTVTPANPQVVRNDSLQLTSTLRDASNVVVTGRPVAWSSSDTGVARVSATGRVFGRRSGTATITATSEGRSGGTTVTVPADVATVTVAPATANVQLGYTQAYSATLRDSLNNVLGGRTVRWSSANTAVARIDSITGVATATATGGGSTTITATSEGRSGTATITVPVPNPVNTVVASPAADTLLKGDTVTITPTLRDAGNAVLLGRSINFTSLNTAIATVTQQNLGAGIAGGRVSAVAVGATGIVVASEGRADTVPIVVLDSVATIEISPSTTVTLEKPATQQLTLTLRNAAGQVLSPAGRSIGWTSVSPSVATVTQGGLVTAVGNGAAGNQSAAIQVDVNGVVGQKVILVTQPVKTVQVTALTMNNYQPTALTVTVRDTAGVALTGRSVSFVSSNPAVATVNATTGVVTPVANSGTTTITATSEGRAGSAAVTIPAVATVQVTQAPVSVGATAGFSATVRDAASNVLSGRPVTWTSGNTAIATVSSTGVVTGVAVGSTTITATVFGVSGNVTVTVQCAVRDLAVSVTTTGTIGTDDCAAGAGFFEERFRFSPSSSAMYEFRVSPSSTVFVRNTFNADTATAAAALSTSCAPTTCNVFGLFAAGDYGLRIRNGTTSQYGQTFSVQPLTVSALPAGCYNVPLGLSTSQPATFSLSLSTTSCTFTGAGMYHGELHIRLGPGQTLTTTMNSTAFDAQLELWHPNFGRVALDDNGNGGTNSRLVYTSSLAAESVFILRPAAKGGAVGAYTLTGQLSP